MNKEQLTPFSVYTTKTVDQVLSIFQLSISDGLSRDQVNQQRKKYGLNHVQSQEIRSLLRIYLAQFRSPFIILLCIVAVLSMIMDSLISGLIIVVLVMINSMLGAYLESTAEQTVQSLKQYLSRRTVVIRAGERISVEARDLVPGDLVEFVIGDVITADVRFVEVEENFSIDESIVTGESEAAFKTADALKEETDQQFLAKNIGFSGSIVVSGQARAVVIAIGKGSTLGVLTAQFTQINKVGSFDALISRFGMLTLYIVLISLSIIFAVNFFLKGNSVGLVHLFMFGSALVAGIVPSSLPLIITFALSHGALQLKKTNTIVKRLSSIIDLGTITVLCTDKTGTLTENMLTVVGSYGADLRTLLKYGAVAGKIFLRKEEELFGFELALFRALDKAEYQELTAYHVVDEIEFNFAHVKSTILVRNQKTYELIIRGGVDAVLASCTGISPQEIKDARAWEEQQGNNAYRVLAIAIKQELSQGTCIEKIENFESGYTFLGIISFEDPIKTTAQAAIKKAYDLGIDLKILSGDSAVVCGVVAHKLELIEDSSQVITGAEFEKASLLEKKELIIKYQIFARVSPAHKYEIVSLMQEQQVVGYVGDGINDLLALKAAHVGIAVYEAVDAVREVADIILLRKSLRSIINAVEEGRYAFVNTMKSIKVMLAANLGNFYSVAIAGLFLDYLPMLPVQIILVDLLSNLPLLTFATDRVSKREIKRPNISVYHVVMLAVLLGLVTTIFDFIYLTRFTHAKPATVQTGWFIWSVLSELVIIFSVRTNRFFLQGTPPSMLLIFIVMCIGVVTVALPYACIGQWCIGQNFFSLVPVPSVFLLSLGALVVLNFIAIETIKLLYIRIWNGYASAKGGKNLQKHV